MRARASTEESFGGGRITRNAHRRDVRRRPRDLSSRGCVILARERGESGRNNGRDNGRRAVFVGMKSPLAFLFLPLALPPFLHPPLSFSISLSFSLSAAAPLLPRSSHGKRRIFDDDERPDPVVVVVIVVLVDRRRRRRCGRCRCPRALYSRRQKV